jgi:hypothetical protein
MPGDEVMWIPRASSLRFLAERTRGDKIPKSENKKTETEHPGSEFIGLTHPSAPLKRGSHGAAAFVSPEGVPLTQVLCGRLREGHL